MFVKRTKKLYSMTMNDFKISKKKLLLKADWFNCFEYFERNLSIEEIKRILIIKIMLTSVKLKTEYDLKIYEYNNDNF